MTTPIKFKFTNADKHVSNLRPLKFTFGEPRPFIDDPNIPKFYDNSNNNFAYSCKYKNNKIDRDVYNFYTSCYNADNQDAIEIDYDSNVFGGPCKKITYTNNVIVLDCAQTAPSATLGSFASHVGENVKLTIDGLEIYRANSGEYSTSSILYSSYVTLQSIAHDGQSSKYDFVYNVLIDPTSSIGEQSSTKLSYLISFESIAHQGELAKFELRTSAQVKFDPIIYDGQNVVVQTLEVPVPSILTYYMFNGESASNSLSMDQSISPVAMVGESSSFNMTNIISMSPTAYVGESLSNDVLTNESYKILSTSSHGESSTSKLTLSSNLNVVSHDGSVSNIDVTFDQYKGHFLYANGGETSTTEFTKSTYIGKTNYYNGESSTVNVQYQETYRPTIQSYFGEYGSTQLLSGVQLKQFNSHIGERSTIFLDEFKNYEIFDGQSSTVGINSLTVPLNSTTYVGEANVIGLTHVGPVLFDPIMIDGQSMTINLTVQRSAKLRFNFRAGESFINDAWSQLPYHIDLWKLDCCPEDIGSLKNVDLHVEMNNVPYIKPTEWTHSTTMLRTFPSLYFKSYSGEHSYIDPNKGQEFTFTSYAGETFAMRDILIDLSFNLSYGNFEQVADDISVEMTRPTLESQTTIRNHYIGEYSKFKFSVRNAYKANYNLGGELAKFELKTDPAFRFIAYGGELGVIGLSTTSRLNLVCHMGERGRLTGFYEPPYIANDGSAMIVNLESTETEYFAEFDGDVGCLLNEHITQDEFGQPIEVELNIEGRDFVAFINGRCY